MKNGIWKALLFLVLGLLVPVLLVDAIYFLVSGVFMFTYPVAWFLGLVCGSIGFFYGMVGYWGITRGLTWQLFGTLAGALLITALRLLLGYTPVIDAEKFLFVEPAWWFGGLVGVLAFLLGVGVMDGWFRAAMGEEIHEEHADPPGGRKFFGVSLDHKVIGVQYLVTALALMALGGTFALIFRTELAKSQLQMLTTTFSLFDQNGLQLFNTLMSLHGIIMIVGILLGVAALMNYLVPMMIGAQDMSFPRLNAFSYWIAVPAAVLLVSSLILGGFDTGWTGYPPLSAKAPLGMQMFFLGVFTAGWASILGSLNLIVTVIRMRARGMTAFRMPIFVWGSLATSIIALTATQLIGLSFQLVMFQRLLGMGFFDPAKGGNPVLFQHLFWFYSHPAVYVFVLPGLGVISELLPVFVRKPLYGYRWVALSSLGIALVGFVVWAHHMFTSGMNEYLRVPFMYSTLLVAVPTGVKFFSWVGTIWGGKIGNPSPTPFLFVLGGIIVFLMGGLTGPPNATVSTDLHLHDTYWVVGHFHDTMFGGYIFPFFAAIYYWYPKATGRRMSERLGQWHFWLMTPAFLLLTFTMMYSGLQGMRRRIADFDPSITSSGPWNILGTTFQGLEVQHLVMTLSAFVIAISILIFFINFFRSQTKGEVAEGNVWRSRSPEWQVPSPMPVHNYDKEFEVVNEPYDYGLADHPYIRFIEE